MDPEFQDETKLAAMLKPYRPKDLEAFAVSAYVNSPKNMREECVIRIEIDK